MPDEWLLEVLCDIEVYAVLNKVDWLVPLIHEVNVAAKAEVRRSAAVQLVKQDNVTHLSPRQSKDARFVQGQAR